MQIVRILRNILNTALYVQWTYYKTKHCKLFFCKLFRIIKFSFLILLREATLESKVTATNRHSSVILLHTSKTCSNAELFSIF